MLSIFAFIGCTLHDSAGSTVVDPPDPEVIRLTTPDGLELEADWYAKGGDAPAALLLHMNPANWDRTSWPRDFIGGLFEDGFSVLVPDRRGTGGSDGEPEDAWDGPNGVNDAISAWDHFDAEGAGDRIIVGASNGTTTALDFALAAAAPPVAMVFMTGGDYTETNHAMSDLAFDRLMFTYSTEEDDWSEAQKPGSPADWCFIEYSSGEHGTHMFEARPEVAEDIRAFLR